MSKNDEVVPLNQSHIVQFTPEVRVIDIDADRTQTFAISLPSGLFERIKAKAEEMNIARSKLVRDACVKYLEEHEENPKQVTKNDLEYLKSLLESSYHIKEHFFSEDERHFLYKKFTNRCYRHGLVGESRWSDEELNMVLKEYADLEAADEDIEEALTYFAEKLELNPIAIFKRFKETKEEAKEED